MCAAIKSFGDDSRLSVDPSSVYAGLSSRPASAKFVGSMPVSFQRHHIKSIQQDPNFYRVSEKTDGVRHLMVFVSGPAGGGKGTVVLLDRKMQGWSPKSLFDSSRGKTVDDNRDALQDLCQAVKPGTVLDGEVVINR